jgi:hypothetical protein
VSQSLKDGTRTNLPKPSRVVWEKTEYGRKIKVNKHDWRSLGDSKPCFRRERVNLLSEPVNIQLGQPNLRKLQLLRFDANFELAREGNSNCIAYQYFGFDLR